MSDLRINNITDRTGGSGPVIVGVSTVSSTGAFTVPVGPTEMRGGRGRGVWSGGNNPVNNTMDYVTIATTGNAIDFGDTGGGSRWGLAGCASATRGLFAGGYTNSPSSIFYSSIEYITISSGGGTNDFGDLTYGNYRPSACNSATRGLFGGSFAAAFAQTNTIDYVTIANTGNATDFGDISSTRANCGSVSSPTRGLFGGGEGLSALIDYVTIATKGDGKHFGDLTVARKEPYGCSSGTRGIFNGGNTPSAVVTIDYVTIATFGDAIDFGDLSVARGSLGACSSSTRGVIGGGAIPGGNTNTIDFVTIATTGNATDFGDMTVARRDMGCCSDTNGGLG